MTEQKRQEIKEGRSRPRFVFKTVIEATFSGYPAKLINVSATGAQIEHADTLKPKSVSSLKIALPRSVDTITLRGAVVWSRMSGTPGKDGRYLYRSGIKFEEKGPAVAASVERIIMVYGGEEDRDSLHRKEEMLAAKARKDALRQEALSLDSTWRRLPPHQRQVDPDKILLINQTLARLQKDSAEVSRLAARARSALEKKGEGVGHDDQTLAVWEYLDRLVPLGMIAEVLAKKQP